MKRLLVGLLFLGACSSARAGVYDLDRWIERPVMGNGTQVVNSILALRAAAVPPPKGEKLDEASPRARYLAQVEQLERFRKEGTLSTVDSISLSGAYIRLGNTREALNVLLAADQNHFLIQANLAGAYQSAGNSRQALLHQKKALALWPEV